MSGVLPLALPAPMAAGVFAATSLGADTLLSPLRYALRLLPTVVVSPFILAQRAFILTCPLLVQSRRHELLRQLGGCQVRACGEGRLAGHRGNRTQRLRDARDERIFDGGERKRKRLRGRRHPPRLLRRRAVRLGEEEKGVRERLTRRAARRAVSRAVSRAERKRGLLGISTTF